MHLTIVGVEQAADGLLSNPGNHRHCAIPLSPCSRYPSHRSESLFVRLILQIFFTWTILDSPLKIMQSHAIMSHSTAASNSPFRYREECYRWRAMHGTTGNGAHYLQLRFGTFGDA
jgi:hypothetical protein